MLSKIIQVNTPPIFYNIELVWDIPFSRFNPLSRVFLVGMEYTLYHEIGHHVHGHTFGQDPDQEEAADKYATKLIGKSHPIFRVIIRTVGKLIFYFFVKAAER